MPRVPPEREVSKVFFKKGGGDQGRGRISVGSGPDFRRLGAGFPSARGRIPVGSGPDSRGPGAERPCAREWSAAPIPTLPCARIGLGPGRGPRAHFSGISAKFMKFMEFQEIPLFLRISVISANFSDFCERVRARGAMLKYLVFLVVFIGIWEPFRPGTHFWAQNPKSRRILVNLGKIQ